LAKVRLAKLIHEHLPAFSEPSLSYHALSPGSFTVSAYSWSASSDWFDRPADRGGPPGRPSGVPAMAFFGGPGDLLVTAAMGDWAGADEAHVARRGEQLASHCGQPDCGLGCVS
jgi:hypothetical protein